MRDKIILLASDSPDDEVQILRVLSENNIANEIAVTRNGIETLEYVLGSKTDKRFKARTIPQLILVDLKRSRLNDLEILRRLRANDGTKLLPVIVLTSSLHEEEAISEQRFQAKSYARKPIEYNEFCKAVRELGLGWMVVSQPEALRSG